MSEGNDKNQKIRPRNPYANTQTARSNNLAMETLTSSVATTGRGSASEPGNDKNGTVAQFSAAAASSTTNTTASASALVISASDKAGMEGIDRARINAIILRESGSSLFMQQQQRRDAKVDERIQALWLKLQEQEKTGAWRLALQHEIDQEIPAILSKRRVRSAAVVVDMDMFYMACELLTRPELAERPACVGQGMILTSNYKARRFGVRSAMAGWIGDKLVEELSGGKEHLVHVPSHFDLYRDKSMIVRKVLAEYDPHLRAYSLDEAYLDVGPYLALKLSKKWEHERIRSALSNTEANDEQQDACVTNDQDEDEATPWSRSQDILASYPPSVCLQAASEIINEMRQRVCDETGGLTCSAGVAPNFMLAKIASDRNKPDGQLLVGSDHDSVVDFLYPLPTRKVCGIGRVTEKTLNAFGIQTVRDLYEERALVRFLFLPTSAKTLLRASLGCSSSDEKPSSEDETSQGQKGISRERTFQSGKSWVETNSKLEEVARLLSSDMQQKNLFAHTFTIKVKLHTFDCLSRSKTMPRGKYLQAPDEMVALVTDTLRDMRKDFKGGQFNVRLLGVRCTNFQGDEERSDAHRMNIEKFLCSKHQADAARAGPRSPPPRLSGPFPRETNQTKRIDPQLKIESFFCNKPEAAEGPRLSPTAKMTTAVSTPRKHRSVSSPMLESSMDSATPIAVAAAPCAIPELPAAVPVETIAAAMVHCPVCNRAFRETDNEALNQHVDACLNGSMVRQAVQESAQEEQGRAKKQRLSDFFGRPYV
jgi:DNA polymerase kappa